MDRLRSQTTTRALDVAAVYRDQFGYVFTNLRRLGVPPAALEDACHDVFVVVHRRARSYDPRCPLRTWLYGVVRRVAADVRRTGGRHRRRLEALRVDEPIARSHDDTIADRRLVQDFLDALDDDKREVFILVELEEMTAREVAAVLAINPNTAAARLRAARRVFAERLCEFAIADAEPRLLAAARTHQAPERARSRVWSGLAPLLGKVASTPAITSAGWVAAVVVAGGTLAATTAFVGPTTPAEPPVATAVQGVEDTPTTEPRKAAVEPGSLPSREPVPLQSPTASDGDPIPDRGAPTLARTESPRARLEAAAIPATDDALRAETELAGRVLRATEPPEILALVDEYRRRFADGFFADRLTARRIEALCKTNRHALADAEHDALSRRQPALARRAFASCESNDHEPVAQRPSSG